MTTTPPTAAGAVVVHMSVSLDGFVAAEGDGPNRGLGMLMSGAVVTGRHTIEWAGAGCSTASRPARRPCGCCAR